MFAMQYMHKLPTDYAMVRFLTGDGFQTVVWSFGRLGVDYCLPSAAKARQFSGTYDARTLSSSPAESRPTQSVYEVLYVAQPSASSLS